MIEHLVDVAEKILNEALGRNVKEAVVRVQEKVYEGIVFDNEVLRAYSFSKVRGMGLSVYIGGAVGYSYTTLFDRDSLSKMVEEALASARALEQRTPREGLKEVEVRGLKDVYRTTYSANPLDVDPEAKVNFVKSLNSESLKKNGIVSAVTRYGFEKDRRIVISSFGSRIDVEVVAIGVSHMAVARHGEVVERVYDQRTLIGGYEHIEKSDWHSFVDEINTLAIKASQAPTIKPGEYSVVVDNELIGLLLHEAFGHASEGDIVYAELSILKNMVGNIVANEKVTIVDEGAPPGGYPVPYDDEGARKDRTYIVRDGILSGYLHSISTAKKLGQSVTGNARAQDISFSPIVRQTNFYMLPGDAELEELFEGIEYGLYLRGRGAGGGQVNPAVGTFTFGVGPSYVIRKGEVAELVRGVIVSGNILEVLKDVELVGRDLNITTSVFGGCGKGMQTVRVGDGGPHVRVRKLVVGTR